MNFLFYCVTDVGVEDSFCNAYFPLSTSLKGLTEKLQFASPDMAKTIDIYTDETAVMYVEEATGSPVRTIIYDNKERFEKLGKQKFTDEILYKKSKKIEDNNSRMCRSAHSISSNSSDDKEYAPLFMKSFTGVLPDIRSPESIKSDIEEKEKILEKILDLDKVKIPDISRLKKTVHDLQNTDTIIDSKGISEEKVNKIEYNFQPINLCEQETMAYHDTKESIDLHNPSISKYDLVQEPKEMKNEPFVRVPCKYSFIS